MISLRQHRFALALLVLLASGMFLPALVSREVFVVRDHFDYFQPLRYFTAQELRAGNLPLWNPYSASGEPWLANPQTGVFYPPAWLFLVLPFATAYVLHLFFHVVLLGWGGHLLFSRIASREAAMLGAAALMLGGPLISLLDISNNLATIAWIPLVLHAAVTGKWKRGGVLLALAFLAGEPFFAALAALLYTLVRRRLDVFGTAAIAIGISAIQLFPFLEFVAMSDRAGGMDDALILRESMPLASWWRLAVPPAVAVRLAGPPEQQFIPVAYVGVVVAVLAIIGVTRVRQSRAVVPLLVVLAAAVMLASGPELLTKLPITIFRYPARLVPIAAAAVAALAAIGWERIRPGKRWVDLLVILVIAADLLIHARPLLATAPFSPDVVPYNSEIGSDGKILRFGDIDPARRTLWISGYLNLYDHRFDAFTAAPLISARYVEMYRELLASPSFIGYAHAGIAWIISTRALPSKWRLIGSRDGVHLYENRNSFPMAALFMPGSKAIRYAPWELDTSSARIEVNAPRAGLLVLRQQAAPGWEVTVDGLRSMPLLVNGVFRGVDVPAGHHRIVWTYRPWSLLAGVVVTLLTLFTLTLSRFVKRRRRNVTSENFSSVPSNVQ